MQDFGSSDDAVQPGSLGDLVVSATLSESCWGHEVLRGFVR